jgi:hypothetical protein
VRVLCAREIFTPTESPKWFEINGYQWFNKGDAEQALAADSLRTRR